MTGAILEISRTGMGGTAHLAGMEMSILLAVVRIAHIIHLKNILAGTLRKILDCVLIPQPVATLDRVAEVRLHGILRVSEPRHSVHAALGHGRCGTGRHQLRHHSHFQALDLGCRQGSTHTGAAAADNQHIIGDIAALDLSRYILIALLAGEAAAGTCSQDYARCRSPPDECAARYLLRHSSPSKEKNSHKYSGRAVPAQLRQNL